MLGSAISGVMLSQHLFAFLSVSAGLPFARVLHMLSADWGFVLMSLHLGFHWGMVVGAAKRRFKGLPAVLKWAPRAAAALLAGYGLYAFIARDIGGNMLLKNPFVLFDFEESLLLLLNYLAKTPARWTERRRGKAPGEVAGAGLCREEAGRPLSGKHREDWRAASVYKKWFGRGNPRPFYCLRRRKAPGLRAQSGRGRRSTRDAPPRRGD